MLYIILKRWLYQYYWYFTYLSGKIIRNIEKSEYDVTVTSSLGVVSQNWVWRFFVRRWSLCVNFVTLALLVPEIQRGVRGAPPVTDWPKRPSLNRVKACLYEVSQPGLPGLAALYRASSAYALFFLKIIIVFICKGGQARLTRSQLEKPASWKAS